METFEFSLLQAFQAEGVKAWQGSGVLDPLTTTGAFHQLGNCKRQRWNENKMRGIWHPKIKKNHRLTCDFAFLLATKVLKMS